MMADKEILILIKERKAKLNILLMQHSQQETNILITDESRAERTQHVQYIYSGGVFEDGYLPRFLLARN